MKLRPMTDVDWLAVADLICVSTNYWYQMNRGFPIFANGPESVRLFCEVYEALDPGCCVLAEDENTGMLMGSCFYHPRPTHVSLGIMNVHPNYFGRGVARALLTHITDFSEADNKPVRLVSSAMNLDSFSLYTKAGFVPRQAFQDMMIDVPDRGLDFDVVGKERVREAELEDVTAIVALEKFVSGIDRTKDFEYLIQNKAGIWHTSVYEGLGGRIDGVLVSVNHPGSNMLGPGVMRSDESVLPLILAELNANIGRSPVFLVPVDSPVVRALYAWGARNCEVHFAQIRGSFQAFNGVVMPTFMPETG
ncbi:MAG: GNAT family N-acetyltransferase [Candidatus Latescibacteria bacterium]|nr:GNAT family N-acetyltransferase [Candidatus Latescibacterota bacterium]